MEPVVCRWTFLCCHHQMRKNDFAITKRSWINAVAPIGVAKRPQPKPRCIYLQAMVKRTLSAGIRSKYLLMDSWFTLPSTVTSLSQHLGINRVLSLAVDQLRKIGSYCEKTASTFFDAIIDTALQCVGLSKNDLVLKPES
jgi:hypothetical protein